MGDVRIDELYEENVEDGKRGSQVVALENYQPAVICIHTDPVVFIAFRDECTEALSDWAICRVPQGWSSTNGPELNFSSPLFYVFQCKTLPAVRICTVLDRERNFTLDRFQGKVVLR